MLVHGGVQPDLFAADEHHGAKAAKQNDGQADAEDYRR
jgi:hypothetical protein